MVRTWWIYPIHGADRHWFNHLGGRWGVKPPTEGQAVEHTWPVGQLPWGKSLGPISPIWRRYSVFEVVWTFDEHLAARPCSYLQCSCTKFIQLVDPRVSSNFKCGSSNFSAPDWTDCTEKTIFGSDAQRIFPSKIPWFPGHVALRCHMWPWEKLVQRRCPWRFQSSVYQKITVTSLVIPQKPWIFSKFWSEP